MPTPLSATVPSAATRLLQILFLAQRSANSGVIERPDLTAAFAGCSVADAACLLRMLYHPQDVRAASFAALLAAGRLPSVAALAYKLNVPSVLSALAEHLAGERHAMHALQAWSTWFAADALRAAAPGVLAEVGSSSWAT